MIQVKRVIGAGLGTGPTTDANLLAAAQAAGTAAASLVAPCPQGVPAIEAFQSAWNASTDTDTTAGTQLQVDGSYGAQCAAALSAALGGDVAGPCSSFVEPVTPTPVIPNNNNQPVPSGMNPVLKWGLILILVAGAGAGLWWLFFSKKGPMRKKRHGAHERKKRKKSRR